MPTQRDMLESPHYLDLRENGALYPVDDHAREALTDREFFDGAVLLPSGAYARMRTAILAAIDTRTRVADPHILNVVLTVADELTAIVEEHLGGEVD